MSRPLDVAGGRQTCAFCPKLCRHACPAAEAERSEESTPTFKQQVALLAAEGRRPLDAERARVLWKCCDCGASQVACRHRVAVAPSLREARAQAVAAGVAPQEVTSLAERFARCGSPYASDLGAARDAAVPAAPDRGRTLLLASCTALARDPEEVRGAWEGLVLSGAPEPALARPEPACCGYPLDALGLSEAFRAHAERFARALRESGAEQVVATGPACAWTLLRRYPALGLRLPPVVPWVDAARRAPAPRRADASLRYAWHDPCFLGRRLRRYGEPRALLRELTGSEPVELSPSGEQSLCSGGGGGYPFTHPEPARGCASALARAFAESGADVLVTGCAGARRALLKADPALRVTTLAALLGQVPEAGGDCAD